MRRKQVIMLVLLAAALLAIAAIYGGQVGGALSAGERRWRTIAPGVELAEAELFRGGDEAGKLYALYFETGRVSPAIEINEAQHALTAFAPDALAVVNAGFFTKERRATGLLVSGGRQLSPFVPEGGGAGSGVFILADGKPQLFPREKVQRDLIDRAELALQAGPRILEPDGSAGIRSDDGQRANRTVIGADKKGRVVVVIAIGPNGWSTGPTLFEMQKLLARDLELRFALNLDGGPSTGLFVRNTEVAIAESAPVHSVLAWRKKL